MLNLSHDSLYLPSTTRNLPIIDNPFPVVTNTNPDTGEYSEQKWRITGYHLLETPDRSNPCAGENKMDRWAMAVG
jgi:hypothetical protein